MDADDLLDKMYNTARETSLELGKLADMPEEEQKELFNKLSLGALKYFIIKVDPRKTMLFDPKESIDFNGNTGPFIQYTYARIKSILRKAEETGCKKALTSKTEGILAKEISIIKNLNSFPDRIVDAGNQHSPAIIANYAYDLAKEFNQYYHDVTILKEEDESLKCFRLMLIDTISRVLTKAMDILGISLPERM